MSFQVFLNLIAASLGFFAACFFVVGIAHLRAADIKRIASSGWGGFSQPLADSFATQRAEYLAGSILLVLSFMAQLAANLINPELKPAALSAMEQAVGLIGAIVLVLLLLAIALRYGVARCTKTRVRLLVASENKTPT